MKNEKNRSNNESNNGLVTDMVYNYRQNNGNNSSYNSRSFVSTQRRNGAQNEERYQNNSYNSRSTNGYEGAPLQKSSSTVQSDLKQLKIGIKQFETGEKRLWPKYLQDLSQLFRTNSFPRAVIEKPGRYVPLLKSLFSNILFSESSMT